MRTAVKKTTHCRPDKKTGYFLLSLYGAGAAFTGVLAASFVVLAAYLVHAEMEAAGHFRTKFLMMPMMNILISSMLFYYSRTLSLRTRALYRSLADNTFVAPRVLVTRYDILGIIGFVLVVAVISYWVF